MWIRWIWNSTFWLGVENKHIIGQNIKYKSMCETQELKMLLIPHFLLAFYELIHLCPNQSLRNLLCFTSRWEDLIRAYLRSKKKSCQRSRKFYILGKTWANRGASKQMWFVPKNSEGFWVLAAVQTLENCNFYPHLSLKTVFPSPKLPQNC